MKINHKVSQLITIKKSPIHGFGIFSKDEIKNNQLILSFSGEVLHRDALSQIKKPYSYLPIPNSVNVLVCFGDRLFNSTYINHSCTPNMKYEFPNFISCEKISKNTELTVDYRHLYFDNNTELINYCNCGSVNCCKEAIVC